MSNKLTQEQINFCIEIVNLGVFNGIIEQWATIKKNSHNRFGGWVSFRLNDDDDETLFKVTTKEIAKAIQTIINENTGLDDEPEKEVWLSFKRLDASILSDEAISGILQIASVGETLF